MGSLRAVYMPILDVVDNRLLALEALLRLSGGDPQGHIPFLEEAEESGEIHRVDMWMLQHVCAQMDRMDIEPKVSINISPVTVETASDLYLQAADRLSEYAPRLIFEITETRPMMSMDALAKFTSRIHQMGGVIALDDFGSGYASLDLVPAMCPDYIKLSDGYVRMMQADPDLVSDLKKLLPAGCELIAEHVDSVSKLNFMRNYGIRYAQGYLVGRPLPLEVCYPSCSDRNAG